MRFDEYDKRAMATAKPEIAWNLSYAALGLNGEAGEFADKVKKVLRDAGGNVDEERREAMLLELGDVLWYIAQAANCLGCTLDEVAQMNLVKVESRRARGVTQGSGDNR